jgi:hypothetical protein
MILKPKERFLWPKKAIRTFGLLHEWGEAHFQRKTQCFSVKVLTIKMTKVINNIIGGNHENRYNRRKFKERIL